MKRILTLIVLLMMATPMFAEEQANQAIVLDANKAVITVQKQPNDEKSVQKQAVKNNWFCIVVQVNGKVIDNTNNK